MSKIAVDKLIALFQKMYREHWRYTWGIAVDGDVDCSGAFVYAYRQFGKSIYHGSNTIARKYVVALLPISEAKPGMAAFKVRKPGQRYYDLPSKFKPGGSEYNGDINDYYHIGLVDTDGKHVLNAQSESAGFTRTALSKWACVGYLKAVDYGGEEKPMETMYVTAESGRTVRMREKPSTGAKIIAEIPVGTEVLAGADIDGWREIIHGDDGGYMMSRFLTAESPEAKYKVICYGMSWKQVQEIRKTCPTADVEKET